MDRIAFEIQTMPLNPSDWQYFWYQLPYSVPSLLSFIIGVFLSGVGIFSAFKRKETSLYLAFSFLTFSFGALSLVIALRGLVYNRPFLLELHKYVYFFSFFVGNSVLHLFYILTEKRYKVINYFNYFLYTIVLWASIDLWNGTGFTDTWNVYAFGQYPKGSTSIRVWGAIASSAFYFLFTPYFIKYYRSKDRESINIHIFIAIFLFLLLATTNLPSLIGFHFYPGGNFFFIPMLYLAYGIFKEDILNIKDILFEKNVLFFAISLFLSFAFLITSLLVVFFITPSLSPVTFVKPYFLIPLFSYFTIFLTVIFIAGNNPNDKVSLLASIALIGNGVFSGIMTTRASFIDPLIELRVEQISYILIALGPCFQWRLIFEIMNLKPNRVVKLVDILCAVSAILAQTPYFFHGYYEYEFGRVFESGIGLMIMSLTAFITVFEVIRQWIKYRKTNENPIADWIISSLLLAGFFMLTGVPSTKGFAFYSLGNMQFIPALMILYAIVKYGSFVVKGPATKLGNRITVLISSGTIVALYFYFQSLIQIHPIKISFLHLALLFPPFYLSFYSFTFVLIRPFSRKLDENFTEIISKKQEIELATHEIERLNEFSKLINSNTDINLILQHILKYLEDTYGIDSLWLLIADKDKKLLSTYKTIFPDTATENVKAGKFNMQIPLEKEIGSIYKTFQTKRPFYINEKKQIQLLDYFSDMDRLISQICGFRPLLQIPLVLKNESIGILNLTSFSHSMDLNRDAIKRIARFGEQITSAIHNSILLDEAEDARKQAEIEKEKAEDAKNRTELVVQKIENANRIIQQEKYIIEKTKMELEILNEITKRINSSTNVHESLHIVFSFIGIYSDINSYLLMLADELKDELYTYYFLDPIIAESSYTKINSIRVSFGDKNSIFRTVYEKKEYYFVEDVNLLTNLSESDQKFIDTLKLDSFLLIPFIVQGKIIGVLCLTQRYESFKLSKENLIRLEAFCNQITGTIHSLLLLQVANESLIKLEETKKEIEKAKKEVEELNQFLKRIHEKDSIPEVLEEVKTYVQSFYGVHYFLWLHNPKENSINFHSGFYLNEEIKVDFLKNGNQKLSLDKKGIHSLASKRKTYTFLSNIKNRSVGNEEEDKNQEIFKMASLLLVPLFVQDTLIGILDFSQQEKNKLTKTELERIYIFCQQVAGIIQNFSLFDEVTKERDKSEKLLLNILPEEVAKELKEKGYTEPVLFDSVSVMFTDFKGFTKISEAMAPNELLKELDGCFVQFDKITERYNLEKLKTIGDSYMCASGLPKRTNTHAVDSVLAGLEIQAFMNQMREIKEILGVPYWELRLGIHSGPLVAGVIGEKKFAYDVWGDTVNIASRMESSGNPGMINISSATYNLVKNFFHCEYRGKVAAKNKGEVDMYFVIGIHPTLSKNEDGRTPNDKFSILYERLKKGEEIIEIDAVVEIKDQINGKANKSIMQLT